MKKIFSLIMVIGILVAFAGSSSAMQTGFEDNDLVMVVYNENDNEVAIDLGSMSDIDFSASGVTLRSAGSINFEKFNVGMSDLEMAVFAGTKNSGFNAYFATTKDTAPVISMSSYISFLDNVTGLISRTTADTYVGASSLVTSYDIVMNSASTAPGYFGGLNSADRLFGEADLEGLLTDGYVDMYLYSFLNTALDKGPDMDTDYTGVIRLYEDGSVVLNPVPVPGSILLLGSGLLGLLGMRRKKA